VLGELTAQALRRVSTFSTIFKFCLENSGRRKTL